MPKYKGSAMVIKAQQMTLYNHCSPQKSGGVWTGYEAITGLVEETSGEVCRSLDLQPICFSAELCNL